MPSHDLHDGKLLFQEQSAPERLRLKLRKQLGTTLKSTVHLADWHGTEVVVKSVKMERRSGRMIENS